MRYTIKQKEQIIILRDDNDKTFSEICKIMKLPQKKARSLYASAKKDKLKTTKGKK